MRSRIVGTGSYLPERIMTNTELEQLVDTSDAWIRERTGIEERRIADPSQTTGDLAVEAGLAAIAAADVDPATVDMVIVGTSTPDAVFPSTACLIQRRLGVAPDAVAMDVAAACSGFIYALGVADRFIRTGSVKRALVIGAETFSRILNWQDRSTCVLFGDGAGAVLLEATTEHEGIINTHLHSDGANAELLHVPWGVSQGYDRLVDNAGTVSMRGNEVFKVAVRTLGRLIDETLEKNGLSRSDIDWVVPHQANIRIIAATAKKLDIPMERVVVTVQKHGNTSAASIPLALDAAIRDGRIQRGQLLLLEAFGAGFTWGSALVRY
ncbi:MAG: ketoacyl-ACP synthase III [Xanthomonadaceae bacterium]|nr:ketoacyl-ACP synthase III [Xanthomonadaceae bacterium]